MADNKRYYWLKLDENFFEDDTIAWLEEQENGKDYVIFYLKLSLKSLQDNGKLIRYVGERLIPYDIKALAKLTNTPPDTVKVAMRLFLEIGLIKQLETGEIYMMQIEEMVGTETQAAQRMRRLRAKENETNLIEDKKPERNNVQECYTDVQKSYTEIEIEKELDIDTEKKNSASAKEIDSFFEEAWSLYPNKKGKGRISSTKKKEICKLGDEFKRCIERYAEYVENQRENGFKELKHQNGSTFFNSGYVDYLDDNFEEVETNSHQPELVDLGGGAFKIK